MRLTPLAPIVALLALTASSAAQNRSLGVTPDQIEWTHLPNLGAGVILHGDPAKPGPYVVRLRVGPNTATRPHAHPNDEFITVISGWIGFGLGPTFDPSRGRVLTAGSFFHLPGGTMHFGWTGPDGAVIQAHGIGPFP